MVCILSNPGPIRTVMSVAATIHRLSSEVSLELMAAAEVPANAFLVEHTPPMLVVPDVLAFFGIVAACVIALFLVLRRPKALRSAYYLAGSGVAIALAAAVTVYFINRPNRLASTGAEAEGTVQLEGPIQGAAEALETRPGGSHEAPENLFRCWDCPSPTAEAYFVDFYIETAFALVPLLLVFILGVDWLRARLRERKQKL